MATPNFSIVVPTHERPHRLMTCLRALCRLDYPRSAFEVIVVDDGSSQSMAESVAAIARWIKVTLHRQENSGPAAARNAGAQIATGELVAFTDDDCAPRPDWLRALETLLEAHPEAIVGGRTVNGLPANRFSQTSETMLEYLYRYHNRKPGNGFVASNNFAVRADAFRAAGGFDTDYPLAAGEDRELCDRWCRAGGEVHYAPDAVVEHRHRLNLRQFWRQHYNYGRGAYRFRRQQARRGSQQNRIRLAPWSFYTGLLRYPFHRASFGRALPTAGLVALAQVATGAGLVQEAWKSREGPIGRQADDCNVR